MALPYNIIKSSFLMSFLSLCLHFLIYQTNKAEIFVTGTCFSKIKKKKKNTLEELKFSGNISIYIFTLPNFAAQIVCRTWFI